jgi:hypothetical protein
MSLHHSPKIVNAGLVLCLDAGNRKSYSGSGDLWRDLSGNNNHGILTNSPTFSSLNGGIIIFNGTNNFVDTQKTAAQLGFYDATYTMEAWVYPTDLTSDKTMFGTDTQAGRQGLHLTFRNGEIYQGHFGSDFGTGTVSINNWYQIVFTYNVTNNLCQIFKNGILQGTGSIASFIGTTNVFIGRAFNFYYFKGNGSIYRIYNRALSQTEVFQNYTALKRRFGL